MAFNFGRNKNSLPQLQTSISQDNPNPSSVLPKLTNAQLSKLAKTYPSWLRDGSSLKQLPGVYHGVLGQVQLQPEFLDGVDKFSNEKKLVNKQQQVDYMNRFTDTERVHQLLTTSRLSNQTLATIWAHVNKTYPGCLTNREVCLALALIAIFQRIEKEGHDTQVAHKNDPFSSVKLEKKPPVPVLYPSSSNIHSSPIKACTTPSFNSVPNELSSSLLIDISSVDEIQEQRANNSQNEIKRSTQGLYKDQIPLAWRLKSINNNAISLIDLEGDKFEMRLSKILQVWLKMMTAMKNIFKRSFDILNVENDRQSALEALNSSRGHNFSRNLCLCYPIAHNIKFKIDELNSLRLPNEQINLLDNNYVSQINDLMISINEYWAVLINLFHESGQTNFIELIMDGLNYKNKTVISKTIEELDNELDSSRKHNICSICHTKFYLTNIGDNSSITKDDYDLVVDYELLSLDGCHYYHAKCANFWINHVDNNDTLPFHYQVEEILKPSNC